MIIEEIIARLKETGTPFLIVDGANELAEIKDRPETTPAAYVYTATQASRPNERINGTLQRSEIDIAVVLVTENAAGRVDAARDIEALLTFVRGKLLGFMPASAADPLEHVVGQVVQIKDRMVWFEDVFATATYLTEQP